MSADIPNAFIQAKLPKKNRGDDTHDENRGEERVIMKITGVLVTMLLKIAPEIYGKYVVIENGKRVLYVEVLRAVG